MEGNFDSYKPLIGMELESVHLMRTAVTFKFCDPGAPHVNNDISLSTNADLCLKEEHLFKPASEYDIIRSKDLADLYKTIGKIVLDFKPLNKKRVCKIDFENLSIFTWAGEKELPDCLFEARKNPNSKNFEWWLIDDQ